MMSASANLGNIDAAVLHACHLLKEHNLEGIEKVSVKISGEKPGIIENVYLKDSNEAYFELHLDTDDEI